ncbi:MAG: EamA family transporter, partial [Rhodobacteraceae bacterium]|nr:EamA family transporter [Paracoccaceae bacterium]
MRLFLLTALTMVAFAANSVLNRVALTDGGMDAELFGLLRLVSGAAMLMLLLGLQGRRVDFGGGQSGWRQSWPVLALLAYIFGFSAAYAALDPGFGALILFSVVQITMFAGALLAHETVPTSRWIGAGLALAGLGWLLWPGGEGVRSGPHIVAMAGAGIGWGIYSLLGRTAGDPLQATAVNFLWAAIAGLFWVVIAGTSGTWS